MSSPVSYPEKILIGLMSGTSMDAIDGVLTRLKLTPDGSLRYELLDRCSEQYPKEIQETLEQVIQKQPLTAEAFCKLNFDVAYCFSKVANQLIQNNLQLKIDAISSHGQTLWHNPPTQEQLGSTLQIGSGSIIQGLTGVTVISDFRSTDMALGGQGAPLVPFADKLLFQHTLETIAVLNLGGLSNTTVIPPSNSNQPLMAFDIGPANALMDTIALRFLNEPSDKDAQLALKGQVVEPLLLEWLSHPYFKQSPPKSTGKETFNWQFIQQGLDKLHLQSTSPEDLMRTALALTEESIYQAFQSLILPQYPVSTIILGGGGTKNPLLLSSLKQRFNSLNIQLKTHQDYGIDNQEKEALAFAILGYARLLGIPTNIATGAKQPSLLGTISTHLPNP